MYVVDLETTSFPPAIASAENGDVVMEIAIVQFKWTKDGKHTIKPVLHCFINPESYESYPANWKESWIFRNGTAVTMVQECGLEAKSILPQIRRILNDSYVTSYNTEFDVQRFLLKEPYNVQCKEFECIMKMSGKAMRLIKPSLKDAATHFLGLDHRWGYHGAMEDALTAAKILCHVVGDMP